MVNSRASVVFCISLEEEIYGDPAYTSSSRPAVGKHGPRSKTRKLANNRAFVLGFTAAEMPLGDFPNICSGGDSKLKICHVSGLLQLTD